MGHEFTCALCGETFEMGRDDEEARAEARATFGALPEEELAVVCDECYHAIDPAKHPQLVKEAIDETVAKLKPRGGVQ